jgi:hypothetical protein
MKNIKIYFTILAVVLPLIPFFSGCDKDKTDPPAREIAIDTVYSIQQIKDLTARNQPYTFENEAVVYAVITMDESQGNIYKELYVQDSTAAILLVFNDKTNLKVGDSVRIDLKGKTVELTRNDVYQVTTLSAAENIVVLAHGRFIEPEPATLAQINNRLFDSKLVKVDGVEFREKNVWGDYLAFNTLASLRKLFNCDGHEVAVLTNGHATFAAQQLPQGGGSMIAIASVYTSGSGITTMQLLVRDINEVDMNGLRCDGSAGDEETIFTESFETDQGDFTVVNKAGENSWQHNASQKCMQMTKAAETNEDWLISPAFDFSDVTEKATLLFEHAIANIPETVSPEYMKAHQTVWVSFDYTADNPNNATWTQIVLTDNDLPSGSNWVMTPASLSLPDSVFGKNKVHIAFKYTCDENESATWRINHVTIKGKIIKK